MVGFVEGMLRGMGWGAAASLLVAVVALAPHVIR